MASIGVLTEGLWTKWILPLRELRIDTFEWAHVVGVLTAGEALVLSAHLGVRVPDRYHFEVLLAGQAKRLRERMD